MGSRFSALLYRNGDGCGTRTRETRVCLTVLIIACAYIDFSLKLIFKCGPDSSISSVTEPSTCQYEVTLQTPLACGDNLSVKGALDADDLAYVSALEDELYDEEITTQGLTKRIVSLLRERDVMQEAPAAPAPSAAPATTASSRFVRSAGSSTSCYKQKEELEAQVVKMTEQIAQLEAEVSTLRGEAAKSTLEAAARLFASSSKTVGATKV